MGVLPGNTADDWLGLWHTALPTADVVTWALRPDCGAIVLFCGTVRDHAEGRPNVTQLAYEAYEEEVEPRLAAIAAEARRRWPLIGRLAMLHRVGTLAVGEASVVVVASAPHRQEAFEAVRFAIDTVKSTVPVWKRETWEGGEDWSQCAHVLVDVGDVKT
ncbi:MAG: molybdenum cofactor biosynthesis protein MoaE [Acidimicrobiales bacterium]